MQAFIIAVILPAVLCRYISLDGAEAPQVFNPRSVSYRIQRDSGDEKKRELIPSLKIKSAPGDVIEIGLTESITLECEAGGNPPPTIHWLKDGKRIPQSVNDLIHDDSGHDGNSIPPLGLSFTRSKLFIDCASPRDAGVYTCVAENAFHRESHSSTLTIFDSVEHEMSAICLSKKSFGSPARIYMWTHNRLEIIGNDVQLFCRSNGEPEPKITWIGPDELPIESDAEKYQVLGNGDLMIHDIEWTDMGVYTCEVKNSHGSDSTSTFLYPTKPNRSQVSAE